MGTYHGFEDMGSSRYIRCDYEKKKIFIASDTPIVPGFIGHFEVIAEYVSEEQWYQSEFAKELDNEDVAVAVAYFWSDLESNENKSSLSANPP